MATLVFSSTRKRSDQRYGLFEMGSSDEGDDKPTLSSEQIEEADILDMFSLLNLSLRTSEYEGSDENMEDDGSGDNRESIEVWRKEYLLSKNLSQESGQNPEDERAFFDADNTSSTSRKWQSHDAATVVVNTGHQIVMEMYSLLSKSPSGKSLLNPAVKRGQNNQLQTTICR